MLSRSRYRCLTVGVHVKAERPDRPGDRVWTRPVDPLPGPVRVREHQHPCHELIWGTTGPRTVEVDRDMWVVPVGAGIWIPAGTPHRGVISGSTGYRCTFVEPGPSVPLRGHALVRLGPAWTGLISHLGRTDLTPQARRRAEEVALDSVEPADGGPPDLPMPADPRLCEVARAIVEAPQETHGAEQWSRRIGWSSRTLLRRFRAETGLSYVQWRTHARIRAGVRILAGGANVTETAHAVGYRTTSAFVRAFRETTGRTPGRYSGTGSS